MENNMDERPMTLRELLTSEDFVSPEQLHKAGFRGSRQLIYNGCNAFLRGEPNGIDCARFGKKLLILTAPLRARLGIATPAPANVRLRLLQPFKVHSENRDVGYEFEVPPKEAQFYLGLAIAEELPRSAG